MEEYDQVHGDEQSPMFLAAFTTPTYPGATYIQWVLQLLETSSVYTSEAMPSIVIIGDMPPDRRNLVGMLDFSSPLPLLSQMPIVIGTPSRSILELLRQVEGIKRHRETPVKYKAYRVDR